MYSINSLFELIRNFRKMIKFKINFFYIIIYLKLWVVLGFGSRETESVVHSV